LIEAQRACLDRICVEAPVTLAGLQAIAASTMPTAPLLTAPDRADQSIIDRLMSPMLCSPSCRVLT